MKNLNFIVQQIKEIFSPVNFIGYSITGSTLINLDDDQSDIDLIIILEKINKPYLSNLISFYDYTIDQYTEVLVEDIYD
jgi:predicted nucleotidyltransferase